MRIGVLVATPHRLIPVVMLKADQLKLFGSGIGSTVHVHPHLRLTTHGVVHVGQHDRHAKPGAPHPKIRELATASAVSGRPPHPLDDTSLQWLKNRGVDGPDHELRGAYDKAVAHAHEHVNAGKPDEDLLTEDAWQGWHEAKPGAPPSPARSTPDARPPDAPKPAAAQTKRTIQGEGGSTGEPSRVPDGSLRHRDTDPEAVRARYAAREAEAAKEAEKDLDETPGRPQGPLYVKNGYAPLDTASVTDSLRRGGHEARIKTGKGQRSGYAARQMNPWTISVHHDDHMGTKPYEDHTRAMRQHLEAHGFEVKHPGKGDDTGGVLHVRFKDQGHDADKHRAMSEKAAQIAQRTHEAKSEGEHGETLGALERHLRQPLSTAGSRAWVLPDRSYTRKFTTAIDKWGAAGRFAPKPVRDARMNEVEDYIRNGGN